MNASPICAVCGTPSPFLLKKDGYDHFRCPECGLIFVHPQPTGSFLADEVYSEKSGYQGNKARDLSAMAPTEKQRKVLGYVGNQGSFLDVGCSNGELLYHARKRGLSVRGVELNGGTASIARANGLDVFVGTFEGAKLPDASFDWVHMGDLIEHVPDPAAILAEARRVLKPGGAVVVLTPNVDCFWSKATFLLWRLFRVPWSCATPPHHLYMFSVGNLERLLSAQGFQTEAVWYTKAPTLKYELGSLHLLGRWKKSRKPADFLFMLFSFALYSFTFALNKLVELLPMKRFALGIVARKLR